MEERLKERGVCKDRHDMFAERGNAEKCLNQDGHQISLSNGSVSVLRDYSTECR